MAHCETGTISGALCIVTKVISAQPFNRWGNQGTERLAKCFVPDRTRKKWQSQPEAALLGADRMYIRDPIADPASRENF